MDPVEAGLVARLRERPNDADTRDVYADWLEEHGRAAESEFLRLQAQLREMPARDERFHPASRRLRVLAPTLEPGWRRLVADRPIEQCDVRFDVVCPKQWAELEPTARGEDVRFCGACKEDVHYARTIEEARAHAERGRCVVVDLVPIRRPGDLASATVMPVPMAGAIAPFVPVPLPEPLDPTAPPPPRSLLARLKSLLVGE